MHMMLRVLCTIILASLLGGCLLISPYNGQVLTSRTQTIPFQAWTGSSGAALKLECMPTNRFGPGISSHGPWTEIDTIYASNDASLDLRGGMMYSASKPLSLPESCWYLNGSNNWYYTSLRVRAAGSSSYFYTLDRDGVECTGASVARRGVWGGWLTDNCYNKYSNSNNYIPWIVMRTQG